PLTAVIIQTRQHEIEARAARAHHLQALRDTPDRKAAPRRHFTLRAPSLALLSTRAARRA
ncbi:MAG TPA: hypothetical protein VE127_09195, partial [Solirubrobacteraceae bacterium]|nr:hypothetical protein [Solirubrobacteraceae bacterium]